MHGDRHEPGPARGARAASRRCGPFTRRFAIARPSRTESAMSANATTPAARLLSHQLYSAGSGRPHADTPIGSTHLSVPPARSSARTTRRGPIPLDASRRRGRARRRGGPAGAARLRVREQRGLGERLGRKRARGDGARGDQTGPGRRARRRVQQVMRRAPAGVVPDPAARGRTSPRRRHERAASRPRSPESGCATRDIERRCAARDEDVQIAAAVDDHAPGGAARAAGRPRRPPGPSSCRRCPGAVPAGA